MTKEEPDYDDAKLVLKLYDLRRETVMRASRSALVGQFWPKSYDDVQAIMKPDHPMNAAFRQCTGYWEMAFGMAKHGIVHPDYLAEHAGEGFFLYAKVKPWLAELRAAGFPRAFLNAEWVAEATEGTRAIAGMVQARVEKQRAAR